VAAGSTQVLFAQLCGTFAIYQHLAHGFEDPFDVLSRLGRYLHHSDAVLLSGALSFGQSHGPSSDVS
jgi:hypothetical protein